MVDDDSSGDGRSLTRRFRALRLIQAIGLAFDLRKLVIAALGLLLLRAGWSGLDWLFSGSASVTPNTFDSSGPAGRLVLPTTRDGTWEQLGIVHSWISEPIRCLIDPVIRDARTEQRLDQNAARAFERVVGDHRLGDLRRCDRSDRHRSSRGVPADGGRRCLADFLAIGE